MGIDPKLFQIPLPSFCIKKQPSRGVLRKGVGKYAANLQEDTYAEVRFQFEIALRHGCSPVSLL